VTYRLRFGIAAFLICNALLFAKGTPSSAAQSQQPPAASGSQSQAAPPDGHEPPSTSPGLAKPSREIFHIGGRPCSEKYPPPCITPPREVFSREPKYSERARKAKYQGVCTLAMIVETDGRPSNIRVLKGLGMGLDENAIEAVKTWKFEPAMRFERDMKDGHPVVVEIAVEVSFRLRPGSKSGQ
jgi:TonB family protein